MKALSKDGRTEWVLEEHKTTWEDSKAVVDGHIITSQGPGTSLQFALKLVEKLYGPEKADELAAQMLTTVA